MSNHVLPVLYISLGGEMLYVLDQRLRAQVVALQKGSRVMGDIVSNMFSKSVIEELFKPQAIYSRKGVGSMFERLVNSSIMRIDADSMEKLYDLMLMTFKYQVLKCHNVHDILHVTLNHFDAILEFVSLKPDAKKLAHEGFKATVKLYENMAPGDLVLMKQSLLGFLHDFKSKVSVLINMGEQNGNGTFVLDKNRDISTHADVPGTIRYCDEGRTESFSTGAMFTTKRVEDSSTDVGGTRTTSLGNNLYSKDNANLTASTQVHRHTSSQSLAEAEVKLLSHLMGASSQKVGNTFKLDLFGSSGKEEKLETSTAAAASSTKAASNDLVIKAEKVKNKELMDIKGDFNLPPQSSEGPDLLSLMDDA